MLCPVCKIRYANFSEEDFKLTNKGFVPKHKNAVAKRLKEFESDQLKICSPECEETNKQFVINLLRNANTLAIVISPNGVATKKE